MPRQTKIKELLKRVGRLQTDNIPISHLLEYSDLEKGINILKKENKILKRQCQIQTEGSIKIFDAAISSLERISKIPVAYLKCAKKNKPEKVGDYGVIISNGVNVIFDRAYWTENRWRTISEVLAFTETNPQHIVDALNKEK